MNERAIELLARLRSRRTSPTSPRRRSPYGNQRRLEIARAMMLEAEAPPPRRARRRHELRRGRGPQDADPLAARHVRSHGRARRAQHAGRHGRVRGHPRARSRRDDRARHARGGARSIRRCSPRTSAKTTTRPTRARPTRRQRRREPDARRPPHAPEPKVASGAPLLELDDVRVAYGGIKALKGVSLKVVPRRDRRDDRRERRRQDDDAEDASCASCRIASGHDPLRRQRRSRGARRPRTSSTRASRSSPEGRAIFPNLTVRENLELGAYLHRDTPSMRETIEDVTKLFPRLGERMTQEGGTLSGGEQQMLAIGRALMARPQLLLLDEPSLGIAPKLVAADLRGHRADRRGRRDDPARRAEHAHRARHGAPAYVLRTGEIALSGDAKELAANPEIQAAYLGRLTRPSLTSRTCSRERARRPRARGSRGDSPLTQPPRSALHVSLEIGELASVGIDCLHDATTCARRLLEQVGDDRVERRRAATERELQRDGERRVRLRRALDEALRPDRRRGAGTGACSSRSP